MNEKILYVDDELPILNSFQRSFCSEYHIETALSGEEGLAAISQHGPFAVVVADMRMPGMDGAQFLGTVRELAPATVRIMLTGRADQQTAIDAVNRGHIFRFLTKPCPTELLAISLNAGIEQYRLVTAEKELLTGTLTGSVQMLIDILAMVHPAAFSRASRVKQLAGRISSVLQVENAWQVEVAAMLSQLGCLTIPEGTLAKFLRGQTLTSAETSMIQAHPKVGRDLVSRIPRLESVAELIGYQQKGFNGEGSPKEAKGGEDTPIGARILKVALDFDRMLVRRGKSADAYAEIERRANEYDPAVLQALRVALKDEIKYQAKSVGIEELAIQMIMAQDVVSRGGFHMISEGQEVTPYLLERLRNLEAKSVIQGPFNVHVPLNFGGLG